MIAIVLKYYEDDYAELRRISIDQFGISGTDL
jgi:hypothetical protein